MTGHWTDRLERWSRLARAPFNFVRFKRYRAALFRGMAVGEAIAGGRPIAAFAESKRVRPPLQARLDILWEPQAPRAVVVASGPALQAAEPPQALQVLADLAAQNLPVRLIVLDAPLPSLEARLRLALASLGLPDDVQAAMEIVDGLSRPVACSPDDLVFAADAHCAGLLADAVAEAARPVAVHRLDDGRPIDAVAEARQRLKPAAAARFPHRSARGLGYRILSPPPADLHGRSVCVFVHYDPGDRLDPHVTRYLSALKGCGLDILLVSSSTLEPAALAEVKPLLLGAICRENLGLDFSGWALAFELFPQLLDCEAVLIANDSVYGPVGDLPAMIARMRGSAHQVWGATRNYDFEEHVQSWFVWFESAALRSDAFRAFWSAVLPLSDKQAIIETYEIPLQKTLERAGFPVGAAADLMLLQVASGNPTIHPWRRLLDHGCPFVKVQLLRDDPARSDLDGWTEELARRGYPVRLILDHLRRTAGRRAAALLVR